MIRLRDADGSCTYVNRRWYEFTGQSPEDALGFGWVETLHPDDKDATMNALASASETKEPFLLEYRIRRADGIWRWVINAAAPRFSKAGEFLGFISSIIDITDRKEMEEELKQANAGLQEFGYAAAHDLQEPLRNVMIYSELLAEKVRDNIDGDSLRYLNYTAEGAKRMHALLTDLLAYTRLAGKEEAPAPVDTAVIVRQVTDILGSSIAETHATIEAVGLPPVMGHDSRLSQLFQNLLSNSIKYRRPDTPPRIAVRAERRGGEWCFSVRDNGIGIDPAYRQQVFGVFKRLHRGEVPGTGIGLAICRRIVEQYGGRIWVDSEGLNQGSTFSFTLPLTKRLSTAAGE